MSPGQLVLVTLNNSREKFWGGMLALASAGVRVLGVDLLSLDDFIELLKSGQPASPNVVFFPINRVQRIEEADSTGDLPSLAEFPSKTGTEMLQLFAEPLP